MQMQFKITMKRPSTDVAWSMPSFDEMKTPWILLGFSSKPDWWDSHYGATYDENCACWSDIKEGKIAQGDRAGTHSQYALPIIEYLAKDNDVLTSMDVGFTEEGQDTDTWTVIYKFNTYDDFITFRDNWTDEMEEAYEAYIASKNITQTVEESYI
jgi:hypothetical protein